MFMPTPFIICVQIIKVLKREKEREECEERQLKSDVYVSEISRSLQNVIRFKEEEGRRAN